jgi:hypothetical protein
MNKDVWNRARKLTPYGNAGSINFHVLGNMYVPRKIFPPMAIYHQEVADLEADRVHVCTYTLHKPQSVFQTA